MYVEWTQKLYPHLIVRQHETDVLYFQVSDSKGSGLYMVMAMTDTDDGIIARVDGGDPGDED